MDDDVVYYACDLVTGVVLDTLPIKGEVAKTRGQTETITWQLPVLDEHTPANWFGMLQPGRVMVVAEYRGNLIQGYKLVNRTRGMAECELPAATLDRLTEEIYVRTGEWYGVDAAQIAAEIVNQVMVPEGGWIVEWAPTGTELDHVRDINDFATVNTDLETLEAAEGGAKWMPVVRWRPGYEGAQVEKVMRFGATLGVSKPDAIFPLKPGAYKASELWEADNAALRVWASTDGDGGTGVVGPFESARLSEGWHPKELALSFTDLDDAQLETRARQSLTELEDGTVAYEQAFQIDEVPILGAEWNIGDTITFEAAPSVYDPVGGTFSSEVEGFVLNPDTNEITPRVIQEGSDREQ